MSRWYIYEGQSSLVPNNRNFDDMKGYLNNNIDFAPYHGNSLGILEWLKNNPLPAHPVQVSAPASTTRKNSIN